MDILVKPKKITATRYCLDMYYGETYIGEYETSIKSQIERKIREIAKAKDYLLDLFRKYNKPLCVRWVVNKKVVRCEVDGVKVEVGEIPRPWE